MSEYIFDYSNYTIYLVNQQKLIENQFVSGSWPHH